MRKKIKEVRSLLKNTGEERRWKERKREGWRERERERMWKRR